MYTRIQKIDETKSFITFDVELTNYTDIFDLSKEEFIKRFKDFKHWREDLDATNFSSQLFKLMCKADKENMERFLIGFPVRSIIFLLWHTSPNEEYFYKVWGSIEIKDINPETLIKNPTSKLCEKIKQERIRKNEFRKKNRK